MNKSPAFQWYPKDYLTDVNVEMMTLTEEGAYRRLMDYEWLSESLPNDHEKLARLCRVSLEQFEEMWPAIAPCFKITPEKITHSRLAKERRKQKSFKKTKSDAGKRGAKARWGKDKNGSAINSPMAKDSSPSPSPSPSPSSTANNRDTTRTRTAYSAEFEELWSIHRRGPKKKAFDEYKKTAKPDQEMQDALESYVRHEINERFSGHDLFRWIRDERWEQEEGRAPKPNGKPTAAGIGREIGKLREAGVVQ